MRFIVLNENFHIGDIKIFNDKIRVVSEGTIEGTTELIYEAGESLRDKLKVLEEIGYIKEIKSGQRRIKSAEDVIRHTDEVILLNGGDIYMRVKLLGKEINFTESELLSSIFLKKQLLRFKEVVSISPKEWEDILCYWFTIAREVHETSEEDEIITKVLNYLGDCVIFKDVKYCMGIFSLYFNPDSTYSDRVYCLVDDLVEFLKFENRRRLRSILGDYILENRQFSVNGKRKRFWGFDIQKTEINFENQLKEEEIEKEEHDEQIRKESA